MDFLSISASPFSTQPPPRCSSLLTTPKHSPFLLLSSRKPSPDTVAPPPVPEKAPVPTISRRPLNPINPVSGGTGRTDKPSVATVNPLSSKLWLSAKLSPPPPPPPPSPPLPKQDEVNQDAKPDEEAEVVPKPNPELRDKAKVFVGNLPFWVKKDEICWFFRQFGPLKKVELIKGHESPQRNVGGGVGNAGSRAGWS